MYFVEGSYSPMSTLGFLLAYGFAAAKIEGTVS